MDTENIFILLPGFLHVKNVAISPFKFVLVLLRHSLAHCTKSQSSEADLVFFLSSLSPAPFTFLHTFFLNSLVQKEIQVVFFL